MSSSAPLSSLSSTSTSLVVDNEYSNRLSTKAYCFLQLVVFNEHICCTYCQRLFHIFRLQTGRYETAKKKGGGEKQRRPTGQLTFIYSSNWPKIRKKKKSKAKPLFFWLNNAKIQCKYFLRLSEKQFVDAAINRRYILRIREQKTRRSRQLLRRKEKGKWKGLIRKNLFDPLNFFSLDNNDHVCNNDDDDDYYYYDDDTEKWYQATWTRGKHHTNNDGFVTNKH